MRVIWRSPATPRPADPLPLDRVGPDWGRPGERAGPDTPKVAFGVSHAPKATFGKSGRPASQPAFLQSAAKPSESRLAPPTRAPSTSGCDISSATFFAFTDPP